MLARRCFSLLVLLLLAGTVPQDLRAQGCLSMSVTPYGSNPITVQANSTGNVVLLAVANTSPPECEGSFPLTATGSGLVTVDDWSPDTIPWLSPGDSAYVYVTFSVGAVGNPYELESVTLAREGYAEQSGSFYVYIEPHGPAISLADHQTSRDVSKCVADCFDAVASYSTPAYYSLDQPRSVQLVYRSSLARPMGFVSVRAWDTTAVYPTKMSIKLKRADGTFETFTNGSQEFFFACSSAGGNYACDSTTNRLAVQFDASTKPTGAYDYTLIVRSHRASGTPPFYETTTTVRVLIQNESSSPFGAGWTVAGYQRVHFVGWDVVITDGNGSISFFAGNSAPGCENCTYSSPAGDFSTFTRGGIEDGADYRRRYPDGVTVGFHGNGRMLWVRNAQGSVMTWYRHNNPPTTLNAIEDVAGKYNSLQYTSGKLWLISYPDVAHTAIAIDGSGNLTLISDAAGGIPFQGTYNSLHRLTRVIDRRGGARGIAYDFAGKLKADTAPAITTVHGSNERPVVRYVSLETALLSDTALHLGSSGSPAAVANDVTVRAKVTNARGFTTSYALDRYGQPLRIEEPQGRTASFQYDELGRRTRDSLPKGQGHVIRYTWSGPNQTQWKDSTTGRTINYTYDATYNLLISMSGDVRSLNNWLSPDKRTVDSSIVGGATRWTRHSYLATPHHHHSCTSSGPSTAYWAICTWPNSYGFRNTDSTSTAGYVQYPGVPHWGVTRYQYDGYGRRIQTVNAVGETMWTQYDTLGRVRKTIGPQQDTTTYTYDSLYLTQVRDARGQVYKVYPNALGWPDSTEDPAGKITRFTYDSGGNQVTIVNRRGQTISFTYDPLDQMRLRMVGTDTTSYFTDSLGRYSAMANRESVDTLKVDAAGRPWVEISCRLLVAGSPHQCFRDSSLYEWRDFRTKLMVTAPGLWSTHTATYQYDGESKLVSMTNFTGEPQAFGYDGEMRESSRIYLGTPNLTLTRGRAPYTPFGGSATLGFSDTTLTRQIGLGYSYDTLSRATRHLHGTLAKPDTIRSFVDSAGRLFRFADTLYTWSPTGPWCIPSVLGQTCDPTKVVSKTVVGTPTTFYYDSVGNRKDSPTQTYSVDPGNRLRRLGYVRMDYDFDGNLVRKRTLNPADTTQALRTDTLFWNALSQVDSIHYTGGGGTRVRVHFGYDAAGRLVRRVFPDFAGTTLRYLWDGNNRIFELDSLGARTTYWTWYPGTQELQSVAFPSASGPDSTIYYVTDALHNVVARLLHKGSTYELYTQYRYGPFGDSLAITGSNKRGTVRYKGAVWEPGYRFYIMGARYYDPDVGRFISEDPVGLEAGINQYAFGDGDPVNGYDPSGTINIGRLLKALGPMLAFAAMYAFLPGSAPAALLAASKKMGVTALAAAAGSGVESISTGESFLNAFYSNFSASSWFLFGSTVGGALAGARAEAVAARSAENAARVAGGSAVWAREDQFLNLPKEVRMFTKAWGSPIGGFLRGTASKIMGLCGCGGRDYGFIGVFNEEAVTGAFRIFRVFGRAYFAGYVLPDIMVP